MYNNPHYIDKLKSLIFYLNNNLKKNNFCMILVISPQLLDLTDGKYENVSKFYEQIKKKFHVLICIKKLKKKFKEYYFKDIYGGHFNAKGNKVVAKILFNYLKKEKFL